MDIENTGIKDGKIFQYTPYPHLPITPYPYHPISPSHHLFFNRPQMGSIQLSHLLLAIKTNLTRCTLEEGVRRQQFWRQNQCLLEIPNPNQLRTPCRGWGFIPHKASSQEPAPWITGQKNSPDS